MKFSNSKDDHGIKIFLYLGLMSTYCVWKQDWDLRGIMKNIKSKQLMEKNALNIKGKNSHFSTDLDLSPKDQC